MVGSFRDTLNLAGKLTAKRAWNAWQIYSSYQVSRLGRKPVIAGMPTSISIEPTTSCNLRCPECPSGLRSFTRPTGMLDQALYQSVIDQLAPTLQYLTFYFQGEPYLNPRFLDMVRYASEKKIYSATSTNGHYLNEANAEETVRAGLDRLIISIDGTSQETYEQYRIGGILEKVLTGTKNIVAAKKRLRSSTPHIAFQFLVVGPNEHQIGDVYKLARSLGVDQVVLKTAQIYDYEDGSPLLPSQDKYSRYRLGSDNKYHLKNSLADRCWKMWHSCVVTWDGKVVPCCFDKDAQYVLGDLTKGSFASIWNGSLYQEFRSKLFEDRQQIEICKNCTEGTKVWA